MNRELIDTARSILTVNFPKESFHIGMDVKKAGRTRKENRVRVTCKSSFTDHRTVTSVLANNTDFKLSVFPFKS